MLGPPFFLKLNLFQAQSQHIQDFFTFKCYQKSKNIHHLLNSSMILAAYLRMHNASEASINSSFTTFAVTY